MCRFRLAPAVPSLALAFLSLVGGAASTMAAEESTSRMTAETFGGLELRGLGPALKSGRIADIAVDPSDRATWYVAVASGGVWKTVNAGTTWAPIFDGQRSYSIGCVTVDPENPNVVWVGTGENNSQRSAGWGDGVYKSLDGGRTWKRMGLETSEHIGKIVLDPRDSDVVWAAAQGPLWAPGGDRGLYKSVDGGESWERVLEISENTGISDVALDPRDPDTVYAASYQRRRRVWGLVAGGPEGAIHKSTDGGASWKKLETGLPGGDLGRIGLALSPQDPDVVYATISAAEGVGGFFRSTDRGESWTRQSDYMPVDPQYYGEIFADPHRFDRVYSMDVWMQVADDGGKTWAPVNSRFKHVDNHALVFDPDDPDYLMVGSDGGIYETFDAAATWRFVDNLPITQFYRVGVDDAEPFYNVYGGTQDNDTQGGPSRTTNVHGIRNSDWFITVGGDGYQTRVEPGNPDILYSMWQYGGLVRYDRASGERVDIQPQPEPGEPPLKWHWDSPLMISPHSPTRLYFAGNKLFRSDDRGDTWRAVSPDLTAGIDRNRLPLMGRVWGPDAVWKNVFTSFYGQIVALDESPLVEGLIYAGTDDGLIQVTEDGGATWRRIDSFPGVPERTYVADLTASQWDPDVVFAAFNNHKSGDFAPYLLASGDRGRSWKSITGDLPTDEPLWSIVQDHEHPGLLFAGTEFSLFFSPQGGNRWIELTGGVPPVAFRDLEIQRRESDLVAATFGRGFYVLDDYSPLREVSEKLLARTGHLFPVKKTWMYVQDGPLGWGEKDVQGDGFYTAPNPPFGAVFTYYLRDGLESRVEQRRKREAELVEKGEPVYYPEWEELRAEDRALDPRVLLVVTDSEGNVVRRLDGPAGAGLHRVAWDLRHPSPRPITGEVEKREGGGASGHPVLPGRYTVTLTTRVDGVTTQLAEPQSFDAVPLGHATLPASDLAALAEFQTKAASLQRAALAAREVLHEAQAEVERMRHSLDASTLTGPETEAELRRIELALADLQVELEGDDTVRRRREPVPPSLLQRLRRAADAHWSSTSAATATHRRSYEIAAAAFEGLLPRLRTLVEEDLRRVGAVLEGAGAPWTPVRGVPDWEGE